MADYLILGTSHGVIIGNWDTGTWTERIRGLTDQPITSIIAREGVILAGTPAGVFRSADLGASWLPASHGLSERHIRWLAYHPAISDCEFAGTEPANIFVSRDGGANWRLCPEVAQLRDTHSWSLPYSPAAGCIRGFAFHGKRVYAAAEVGGVLRSDDTGATWRIAAASSTPEADRGTVHPDVHDVLVHPHSPELVFAATGGGLYRSADGGETWECLYRCYCRTAWIDPNNPQHIILGAALPVERQGKIEETRDGGQTWRPVSAGLATPWPNTMVERFLQASGWLLALLSNGELLGAPLESLQWRPIVSSQSSISAAVMEQPD